MNLDWLERLNELKNLSGQTLDDIAITTGIPRSSIGKIFAGVIKNPSYSTIRVIVNSLGFSVNSLDDPIGTDPQIIQIHKKSANSEELTDERSTRVHNLVTRILSLPDEAIQKAIEHIDLLSDQQRLQELQAADLKDLR